MELELNHFSIRTTDLAACRRFYADVLGLTVGPRPDFPFPGLWMYKGPHDNPNNAVVHIIGVDGKDAERLRKYQEGVGDRNPPGSGAVDHLAFYGKGLAATRDRLTAQRVPFRERTVPGLGLTQLFLEDPHGVVIEINFAASEASVTG